MKTTSRKQSFVGVSLIVIVLMSVMVLPVAAQSQTGSGAPPIDTTPDLLALVAGGVLSLFFSYVPKLNTAYAALETETKRLIMLALLLLTAVAIYGLGCGGLLQTGITCDQQGLTKLVYIFILAMISNQTTFTLTPQTNAVKAIKAV